MQWAAGVGLTSGLEARALHGLSAELDQCLEDSQIAVTTQGRLARTLLENTAAARSRNWQTTIKK